jgi:hypothetical protein
VCEREEVRACEVLGGTEPGVEVVDDYRSRRRDRHGAGGAPPVSGRERSRRVAGPVEIGKARRELLDGLGDDVEARAVLGEDRDQRIDSRSRSGIGTGTSTTRSRIRSSRSRSPAPAGVTAVTTTTGTHRTRRSRSRALCSQ